MKILISGFGHVGKATQKLFPNADIYDPAIGKHLAIIKYDCCFVCVPTPPNDKGECDTSCVEDVLQKVDSELFIILSTMWPGATEYFVNKYKKNIVFSPEYIGSSSIEPALGDKSNTRFLILGGFPWSRDWAVEVYKEAYNSNIQIIQMGSFEAELVKLVENAFIASKVTFFNEIYEICKKLNVDYNIVREGFLADPRMSRYFTFIYENNRGWGGHCLPKDMSNLIKSSEKAGYNPEFLKAVVSNNNRFKEESNG